MGWGDAPKLMIYRLLNIWQRNFQLAPALPQLFQWEKALSKRKKNKKKNGPSSSKELASIQEGKQNRKVCQIRAATGLGSWKAVMEINLWKAKQNT